MQDVRASIPNLSQLDLEALKQMPQVPEYEVVTPTFDRDRHNELATIAVVGGLALVQVVANYYFGKRKTDKIDLAIDVIKPDGTRIRVILKLARSEIEPTKSQIFSQIKHALENE